MTNEEASIIIGNIPIPLVILGTNDKCYSIPEYQQAKAMAIEALEQEPCDDCISRQTVHDLIAELLNDYLHDYDREKIELIDAEIAELPSVTPKQQPCEDVVRKDCDKCAYYDNGANDEACNGCFEDEKHLNFKPKAQYCEDCISRQAVLDIIMPYCQDDDGSVENTDDLRNALDDIESLPPITPKKKTGHWTRVTDKTGHLVWECGCGWQQRFATNFCPDCGARMEVSE